MPSHPYETQNSFSKVNLLWQKSAESLRMICVFQNVNRTIPFVYKHCVSTYVLNLISTKFALII